MAATEFELLGELGEWEMPRVRPHIRAICGEARRIRNRVLTLKGGDHGAAIVQARKWLTRTSTRWPYEALRQLTRRELDILAGCLYGVASALGEEPEPYSRLRTDIGKALGMQYFEVDGHQYEPWRERLGLRPKPPQLAFMTLDHFIWNKATLTPRLMKMVELLAKHIRVSSRSSRPIAYVRLIGHTDNTGSEKYNHELGNRRAQAVKKALEDALKDDILSGRIRVAISIEESPGSSAGRADNKTALGKALNRRVEVFVGPPVEVRLPPPNNWPWPVPDPGPGKPKWLDPIPPIPPSPSPTP